MEIKDKYVMLSFVILILLMVFTLFEIQEFIKIEQKCESGFNVINQCGCFPDKDFEKLFGYNGSNIGRSLGVDWVNLSSIDISLDGGSNGK